MSRETDALRRAVDAVAKRMADSGPQPSAEQREDDQQEQREEREHGSRPG